MNNNDKTILIGIGNSGREDDALGWLFLDEIEKLFGNAFDYEYRYQLQVEDAELISHYDKVYFIDASVDEKDKPFRIKPLQAVETHQFTTHELPPETVLYLCKTVYNKTPDTQIIGIFGNSFELKIGLTNCARKHLDKSIAAFNNLMQVKAL